MVDFEIYERSYCKCDVCKIPCRVAPGYLVPGDLHKVRDMFMKQRRDKANDEFDEDGINLTEIIECRDYVRQNFQPTWSILRFKHGKDTTELKVPVIIPAQKGNGECVFFKNEECSIHQAAPLPCRIHKMCDVVNKTGKTQTEILKCAMESVHAIMEDFEYLNAHRALVAYRKLRGIPILESAEDMLDQQDKEIQEYISLNEGKIKGQE